MFDSSVLRLNTEAKAVDISQNWWSSWVRIVCTPSEWLTVKEHWYHQYSSEPKTVSFSCDIVCSNFG